MSIDVFGHSLNRAVSASRGSCGPSSVGFKVTSDGNYEIDEKRLYSVEDAEEQYDANNLRLVQRIVQNEIRTLYEVTLSMRNEINSNNIRIQSVQERINETMKNQEIDTEQKLVLQNTKLIAQSDMRLNALENGPKETNSSHGVT